MAKRPPPFTDWKLNDEVFQTIIGNFDIKKAKEILKDKPRRAVVSDISTWFDYVNTDKNKITIGIHIDKNALDSEKIDISVPVIECIIQSKATGKPARFLIDGWHRIAKVKKQNSLIENKELHITKLPLVVLSQEETEKVMY